MVGSLRLKMEPLDAPPHHLPDSFTSLLSECSLQERLLVVLWEHSQGLSFEIPLVDHFLGHFPDGGECGQRH